MKSISSLPHSQSPPPVPTLSPINPVHSSPSQFFKIHLILSSHTRLLLPSGIFPSDLPSKALYVPLLSTIRTTCSTHLILFDSITEKLIKFLVNENTIFSCKESVLLSQSWGLFGSGSQHEQVQWYTGSECTACTSQLQRNSRWRKCFRIWIVINS